MKPVVSALVLTGGNSSRMGTDKAFVPVANVPLIQRVLQVVTRFTDDVYLICNDHPVYATLGYPMVADLEPGQGPLMGLYSGLHVVQNDLAFLLACDMPFLQTDLLGHMLTIATDHDVVVPLTTDGYHPLHALYRVHPCLQAIEEALVRKQRRMISFFPQVRVREIRESEISSFDPGGIGLINVNDTEDLMMAEQVASQVEARHHGD